MRLALLPRLVPALALACVASLAQAGAWPREKGELFIAVGGNMWLSDGAQLPVHTDPTLYAEFGLTERLTLGLDLHTADKGQILSGFVFALVPIGDLEARNRYAVSFAYGTRIDARAPTDQLLRGGLHWGRGYDGGWFAIDATATYGINDPTWRPKADLTWGRHWSDSWTTTLQLQTGQGFTGDLYAKISPTVIYNYSDDVKFAVGAVQGLTGDRGSGLKIETWISF